MTFCLQSIVIKPENNAEIKNAIIWNIIDRNNNSQGQAVLIMDHSENE